MTPISGLEINAVKTDRDLAGQRTPLFNIRNGIAKAVIHDVSCETETMALLEIFTIGNQQVVQGRVTPLAEIVKRLRGQLPDDCGQRR